jgi:hypothetical protein
MNLTMKQRSLLGGVGLSAYSIPIFISRPQNTTNGSAFVPGKPRVGSQHRLMVWVLLRFAFTIWRLMASGSRWF